MPGKACGLYLTEGEIAREVFGAASDALDRWVIMASELERAGLPKRERLAGDRRYWPAVKSFLDSRHGLAPTLVPDGGAQTAAELETWR